MRINKYIAQATDLSRRGADQAIAEGRVLVNGQLPNPGSDATPDDTVTLDGKVLAARLEQLTILLNKPAGYVCSRNGQGSRTIYDLLPKEYQHLNSVGRLDKNSSGLLLLTDDGQLAQELTHPSHKKQKIYQISLNRKLTEKDLLNISKQGVQLEDGLSKFKLEPSPYNKYELQATLTEGRNRQIRRTFEALGYTVTKLHRTQFGEYILGSLARGKIKAIQQ